MSKRLEIIIFDMDDTISESKTDIKEEMAHAISNLLSITQVGIISGCAYTQFTNQLLQPLEMYCPDIKNKYMYDPEDRAKGLYLMPSSGAQLYHYQNDTWVQRYNENLHLREKVEIYTVFELACEATNLHPLYTGEYGEIAEDRESQITFSMLGQRAPLEVKKPYDPDQSKRLRVASWMNGYFAGSGSNFEVTVGGASSMDVTRKGSNKGAGVDKLIAFLDFIPKERILFVADALFPGGNDYSVRSLGIDCIQVKNPEETLEVINCVLDKERRDASV